MDKLVLDVCNKFSRFIRREVEERSDLENQKSKNSTIKPTIDIANVTSGMSNVADKYMTPMKLLQAAVGIQRQCDADDTFDFHHFRTVTVKMVGAKIVVNDQKTKLIVDTDAGSDDAMSLLLLLTAEARKESDFEVIAVTCTYGNADEHQVEQNVVKTLSMVGRSDIAIFGGAERPLMKNIKIRDGYFGADGMGDFNFQEPIIASVNRQLHAANALVNLVNQNPGDVSIMVLGALTNIALAVNLDPTFATKIKTLYIMGGSVAGVGNKSPGVEYNFAQDPEAVYIVLNSTLKNPIILLPWETTLKVKIPTTWRTETFRKLGSKLSGFMDLAESKSLAHERAIWDLADPMLAAAALWPVLITKKELHNVTPVVDGAARGTLLVDYADSTGKSKNVEIIKGLDVEEYKRKLLIYFA